METEFIEKAFTIQSVEGSLRIVHVSEWGRTWPIGSAVAINTGACYSVAVWVPFAVDVCLR